MSDEPKKTRRGQFVRRRPLAPDAMAYRVPQVAESLGVSESKVWKLIAQGELQARKIGRSTVIRTEDLKAYLDGTAPARAQVTRIEPEPNQP